MTRNKRKHLRLNPPPTITFAGSELDRILEGYDSPKIRQQLYKAEDLIDKVVEEEVKPMVGTIPPLRLVMLDEVCNCGNKQIKFGYFCRVYRVDDCSKSVTVPDAKGEAPKEIAFQGTKVPFCESCLSRLNLKLE